MTVLKLQMIAVPDELFKAYASEIIHIKLLSNYYIFKCAYYPANFDNTFYRSGSSTGECSKGCLDCVDG